MPSFPVPPDLQRRVEIVLRKLATLSENVRAYSFDTKIAGGRPESSPPPGTILGRDLSKCPPKERSLYDFYSWQFEHARDVRHLLMLCALAERDFYDEVCGIKDRDDAPDRTIEADYVDYILRVYVGVDSVEVAAYEGGGVRPEWVERIRQENDRDPRTGRPRPNWRGMDADERRRLVASLAAQGWTVRQIARHLGIGKSTVARYT